MSINLRFNDLHVQLSSPDAEIQAQWARLFAGWPRVASQPPNMILRLELTDQLANVPTSPPFFSDSQHYPGENGILDVYQRDEGHVLLHFLGGALIEVPLQKPTTEPLTAAGMVTPDTLHDGRFLDVTYTSLAPLFRRYGYYMVHAFAAAQNGRGVLIVGPSGSGKTTTGLSLVLAGWQLLSNDVLLIQNCPDGVIAQPTPDDITIRPKTFRLLPALARFVPQGSSLDQPVSLTGYDLTNGRWADPTLIQAIYHPEIEGREKSEKRPLSRAVCLARLMEQSIDRWDAQTLPAHLNALQTLCRLAQPYTLHLGLDVSNLPDLLA